MQTIGILGGMGWPSTALYYRLLNEGVSERLGGHHSAHIILSSVNFADVFDLAKHDDWDGIGALLVEEAQKLTQCGADFIAIASNTAHRVADQIEQHVPCPLLHIADPLGRALKAGRHKHIGLMGTDFFIEHPVLNDRLLNEYGLHVLTPSKPTQARLHDAITNGLALNNFDEEILASVFAARDDLIAQGVDALALACTELSLALDPNAAQLPLFDTTGLHVAALIDEALKNMSNKQSISHEDA